jgi:hypothetical protein
MMKKVNPTSASGENLTSIESRATKQAVEKRFYPVILIRQPTEKNLGSCRIKQLQGSFVVRQ